MADILNNSILLLLKSFLTTSSSYEVCPQSKFRCIPYPSYTVFLSGHMQLRIRNERTKKVLCCNLSIFVVFQLWVRVVSLLYVLFFDNRLKASRVSEYTGRGAAIGECAATPVPAAIGRVRLTEGLLAGLAERAARGRGLGGRRRLRLRLEHLRRHRALLRRLAGHAHHPPVAAALPRLHHLHLLPLGQRQLARAARHVLRHHPRHLRGRLQPHLRFRHALSQVQYKIGLTCVLTMQIAEHNITKTLVPVKIYITIISIMKLFH